MNHILGQSLKALVYVIWGLTIAALAFVYFIIAATIFTGLMNPNLTIFGINTHSFVCDYPYAYWGVVLLLGATVLFSILRGAFKKDNKRDKPNRLI